MSGAAGAAGAGGGDGVVFRRAGEGDAPAMAEVWLRSFAAALPAVRRAHDDAAVRAWFAGVVVPGCESWVAVAEGAVVGMLVLEREGGELEQLYLDPAWRGRGLGERLLALAKRRRPRGLELWTFQVNGPARRFYERHGFVAVECTDGSRNEEGEPDIRYAWHGEAPPGAAPLNVSR